MKVVGGHLVYTGGSLPDSINKEDIVTVEVASIVTEIATKALMACVNLLGLGFPFLCHDRQGGGSRAARP